MKGGLSSGTKQDLLLKDPVLREEGIDYDGESFAPRKKGIFISQDKYVHEILRKFNYSDVKSASTPTDLEKPCFMKESDDVSPKTSHLLAVKRIFRYLKGKPSLGLWYSKDSPLEFVAYTDSDYAGAHLIGSQPPEFVE
ncbi:hypothetical protein Tco_0734080 [Tanacetum coccineum]